MSDLCQITPISAFMSTNLSSKIECYQALGQRIMRMLGHPIINVEIHPDQLYDAISMACEFYTKYAGYTQEFLVFDSRIYELNKGIRLDHLFTVANTQFTLSQKLTDPPRDGPDLNIKLQENLYICTSAIPYSYFLSSPALSSVVPSDGIGLMQIVTENNYATLTAGAPSITPCFTLAPGKPFTVQCVEQPNTIKFNNMFDYDIMEYRKVIDVVSFEEGSSSGVNTLFSLESTMAQQSYYSYAMGNFGFDILSWHCVKDWMKTREKVLATRRDVQFDNRTQYLRLLPQPRTSQFFGILECYLERPLRDIVKEKWVLEYAIALSKIMWGRILTKIVGAPLLGGGTLDGSAVLAEGIADKKELENLLVEGGWSDAPPIMMQIG